MSKKISRTLILAFFSVIIIMSYSVGMLILSMFGCFMLGFVISAIVSKEQDNMLLWAGTKGIYTGPLEKKEDANAGTKRKGYGKTKQKA